MDDMTPNRYGGEGFFHNGKRCCRHSVPLWEICRECNQLLARMEEKPTLFGTGDVVEFEPLAELEELDGLPKDTEPRGGGSIKA